MTLAEGPAATRTGTARTTVAQRVVPREAASLRGSEMTNAGRTGAGKAGGSIADDRVDADEKTAWRTPRIAADERRATAASGTTRPAPLHSRAREISL
jgi:hypothetical protein